MSTWWRRAKLRGTCWPPRSGGVVWPSGMWSSGIAQTRWWLAWAWRRRAEGLQRESRWRRAPCRVQAPCLRGEGQVSSGREAGGGRREAGGGCWWCCTRRSGEDSRFTHGCGGSRSLSRCLAQAGGGRWCLGAEGAAEGRVQGRGFEGSRRCWATGAGRDS